MNDRYLFRGKRLDNGEWETGALVWLNTTKGRDIFKTLIVYSENIKADVVSETIGQCTGIKDKNGVLIFEGDIVTDKKEGYSFGYSGVVFWDMNGDRLIKSCSYRVLLWAPGKVNSYERALSPHESERLTIIGNIHDTPELLEKSEVNK